MSGSGRIPRGFIDDLLVRVDIVDLIDSHVPLKKAGSSYVARCPFHAEKSPSFSVNRKKQFYHCFGCGVGGNAVTFLMEFSHLSFVEAIDDLAGFVGVDVPREVAEYQGNKHDYSAIYSLLEQVAVFYVEQLRLSLSGKKAVDYLKARGVDGEIAKTFSLGYAPDEWSALSNRFDQKLLLDAGVVVSKDDGRVYDRFRGRLIFPIKDKRKRVIGFGGRVLDDSLPKYINSPETGVFSKAKELYGLSELLEKDSKPKRILVVEGYMDVIALAQAGISFSVAALGTATSKMHLDLLFRFTSELVFCFDGDVAGQKAAWRAVQESFSCLKDGRQVKVMLLPVGQDPDSLIRDVGLVAFEERIENAEALSSYFFEYLSRGVNLDAVEGKAQLTAAAKPYIEKIPAGFFREMMLMELEKQVPYSSVGVKGVPVLMAGEAAVSAAQISVIKPELVVLALLLQNPEMSGIVEEMDPEWGRMSFQTKEGLRDVLKTIEKIQPENTGRLLEVYRNDHEKELWLSRLANLEVVPSENDEFDIKAEFKGALERVFQQGRQKHFDNMIEKKLN